MGLIDRRRGQTSLEYLLLIGAVILGVVVLTVLILNVISANEKQIYVQGGTTSTFNSFEKMAIDAETGDYGAKIFSPRQSTPATVATGSYVSIIFAVGKSAPKYSVQVKNTAGDYLCNTGQKSVGTSDRYKLTQQCTVSNVPSGNYDVIVKTHNSTGNLLATTTQNKAVIMQSPTGPPIS